MVSEGHAHYLDVATDLARRIAAGELREGANLHARSDLPGEYGFSRETIRRAVALLSRWGAVQVSAGSGIRILSANAASRFLAVLGGGRRVRVARERLRDLLDHRRELDTEIEEALDQLIRLAEGHPESSPD
jgi:DNA-binding GntR family transcriptional regulator